MYLNVEALKRTGARASSGEREMGCMSGQEGIAPVLNYLKYFPPSAICGWC
jgi:hypothetical protein